MSSYSYASHDLIAAVRQALHGLADAAKAAPMQAYMKSEMPFLGVQTPLHRAACREIFADFVLPSLEAWRDTILVLWRQAEYREERYAAINLTGFPAYRPFQRMKVLPMYREMITTGAWWDYVDAIAVQRLGELRRRFPRGMASQMRAWARSRDTWKRRSAIICQIKLKAETDLTLLYDAIAPAMGEREFFLRKAIGWALREHAKTDPREVIRYVRRHKDRLSPLSKREAVRNLIEAGLLNAVP